MNQEKDTSKKKLIFKQGSNYVTNLSFKCTNNKFQIRLCQGYKLIQV